MIQRISPTVRSLMFAILGLVAIIAIWRGLQDTDALPPPPDVSPSSDDPNIRVAREVKPTIVESNDDWLDETPEAIAPNGGSSTDSPNSPTGPPTSLQPGTLEADAADYLPDDI